MVEQRPGRRMVAVAHLPFTANVYVCDTNTIPRGLRTLAKHLRLHNETIPCLKELPRGKIFFSCTFERYARSAKEASVYARGAPITDWSRTLLISRIVRLRKPIEPTFFSCGVRYHVIDMATHLAVITEEEHGVQLVTKC